MKTKCMKNSDIQEQKQELERAKASHRRWISNGKVLDYKEFESFMKDVPSGEAFCKMMTQRGFVVKNQPMEKNERKKILQDAHNSIKDTCTRLLNGEDLDTVCLTDYRRFLLAVLTEEHMLTEQKAADFKVKFILFTNLLISVINLHLNRCVKRV